MTFLAGTPEIAPEKDRGLRRPISSLPSTIRARPAERGL